jgi:hypothetical protein
MSLLIVCWSSTASFAVRMMGKRGPTCGGDMASGGWGGYGGPLALSARDVLAENATNR